ncbi:MAG: DUF4392 domain-containing protein [Synergistaceae bacterium]|nr:DUF4392 domain-containing protein [Synergistaceae bacterium]
MGPDVYSSIRALVASDRSERRISSLLELQHLAEARKLLEASTRVAVVTGFYVPACRAPETDGPGGAVMIARALERSGRDVSLFTDTFCVEVLRSASYSVNGPQVKQAESGGEIIDGRPDLVIYLERLGRAADGKYYNMRGEDVSSTTPPLDEAALLAQAAGISVLAVGDGGNEVGMGNYIDRFSALLPHYAPCLSVMKATVTLPVDVSDWGGYALTALLSLSEGRWLGPEREEIGTLLEALVNEGAVDGISRLGMKTVDGFSLEVQEEIAVSLKKILLASLSTSW